MYVTLLNIDGFKKISAVEIRKEKDDHVTIVSGKNEQGKSSILDALSIVFGGKRSKRVPPVPVNSSKKSAVIEAVVGQDEWEDGDGGYQIKRTIRENGTWSVEVRDRDGRVMKKPETVLAEKFGEPIDIGQIIHADGKSLIGILKEITGKSEEFDKIDGDIKSIYDERKDVNKDVKRLEVEVDGLKGWGKDTPDEPVKIIELVKELNGIEDEKMHLYNLEKECERLENEQLRIKDSIEEIDEQIEKLKNKRKEKEVESDKKMAKIGIVEKEMETARKGCEVLSNEELKKVFTSCILDLKGKIEKVEEINNDVRMKGEYEEKYSQLEILKVKSEAFTNKINKLKGEKSKILSDSFIPVPNLTFDEDQVFYNGLPFDPVQLSTEEIMRVAFGIAIGINMAKEDPLDDILIRDGNDLDEENLAYVCDLAKDAGVHLWIERIEPYSEAESIVIKGGKVREIRTVGAVGAVEGKRVVKSGSADPTQEQLALSGCESSGTEDELDDI